MPQKVVRKKSKKTEKSLIKREIFAIAAIGISIFFIVSIWFNVGGKAGEFLTNALRGLFGNVAFALPVFLIASAVMAMLPSENKKYTKPIIISTVPVLISMLSQLSYRITFPAPEKGILELYKLAEGGKGGGVIGGILSEPLLWLLGSVGSFIIVISALLIMFVMLFEISVVELIKKGIINLINFFKSLKEEQPSGKTKVTQKTQPIKALVAEEKPAETHALEEYNWATEDLVINDLFDKKEEHAKPLIEADDKKEEPNQVESDKIEPIEIEAPPIHMEYVFPSPDLLYEGPKVHTGGKLEQLKENAQKLVEIFESFGIETKVTNITRGSSITRYEVVPAAGIKVNKITALDQDIALRLPANNVRIEVLPGYIGVEVSNDSVSAVYLRGLIENPEFKSHSSKLAVAVGRDINGNIVTMDIAKTPHLLIAGATGSGKSVCINTIISSILYKASPDEVKLVMVDPKVVELGMYNGIPHLLVPIVTDPRKAAGALCWAVQEMEDRYAKFAEMGARDLNGYNKKLLAGNDNAAALPQIVIIIDELADLMMVAPGEVQDYICRLAQKARAAGMHLVLATQRPSVDVITGLIKANIPSRISFAVSSAIDSRTILDCGGAEKLMGKGDMLMMLAGASKMTRVQGAFVSDTDVENIVNFVKKQTTAEYNHDILKTIEVSSTSGKDNNSVEGAEFDELFEEAAEVAFELGQVSASMLQRRLKVGYARAGRLIDILDKKKVISTYDGSNKPRTLQMTRQEFNEMMEKE